LEKMQMERTGSARGRGRSLVLAAALVLSGVLPAFGFNYERYAATDLDTLLARRRPAKGVDIYPALPLKLTVTLAGYGEPGDTGLLMRAVEMAGVPKDQVDAVKVTRCIKVQSAKSKVLRVFIQDGISDFLPKEVPLGKTLTLYAVHLFTDTGGPGLLVNEFKTGNGSDTRKSTEKASSDQAVSLRTYADNVVGEASNEAGS
jgi:hypothetical protein